MDIENACDLCIQLFIDSPLYIAIQWYFRPGWVWQLRLVDGSKIENRIFLLNDLQYNILQLCVWFHGSAHTAQRWSVWSNYHYSISLLTAHHSEHPGRGQNIAVKFYDSKTTGICFMQMLHGLDRLETQRGCTVYIICAHASSRHHIPGHREDAAPCHREKELVHQDIVNISLILLITTNRACLLAQLTSRSCSLSLSHAANFIFIDISFHDGTTFSQKVWASKASRCCWQMQSPA